MSPAKAQIRSGCPLTKNINEEQSFIHKTFYEFFTAKQIIKNIEKNANINPKLIVKSEGVSSFLKEMASPEEIQFKLVELLCKSKEDTNFIKKAANSITILNLANYEFSGLELSNIQIEGAILNQGNFIETNFQKANLKNVNFVQSNLAYADCSNANMEGVEFGERPYIECESDIIKIE